MARKRYKLEEFVGMLRQAEVLHGLGMSMADATRQLGISDVGTVSPAVGVEGGDRLPIADLQMAVAADLVGLPINRDPAKKPQNLPNVGDARKRETPLPLRWMMEVRA